MGPATSAASGEVHAVQVARVRDAANSGISRPVGSNVNQCGQPVTGTGVPGPTGKLCKRHRNTPRRGIAYQPTRPRGARTSAVWKYSSKADPVWSAPYTLR